MHVTIRLLIAPLVITVVTGAIAGGCGDDKPSGVDTDTTAQLDVAPDTSTDVATVPDTTPIEIPECNYVPILGRQFNNNTRACVACMGNACYDKMVVCGAVPDCIDRRNCYTTCKSASDGQCFDACDATRGGFSGESADVLICRNEQCGYECTLDTCVGNVTQAEPASPTVTLVVTVVDYFGGAAVPALDIKVCAKTDLDCAAPLQEGVTDTDGSITLTVPTAPDGLGVYFAVSGDAHAPTDFWYAASDPAARFAAGRLTLRILGSPNPGFLAQDLGLPNEWRRGLVLYTTRDCGDFFLSGMTVAADTADEKTRTGFLLVGRVRPEYTTTGEQGEGVFADLPLGPVTFTATGKDGRRWGVVRANVRAGQVLSIFLPPTPLP